MRSKRIWQLAAVGAAAAIAGCCVAVWLTRGGAALVSNSTQAQAMMPSIIAYLESPSFRQDGLGGYTSSDYQSGRVKWLCNAALVEVRSDGERWQAGMDVACGDYDRRSSELYKEDGGDLGHVVMVLSGDGLYQIVSAARENDVVPDPAWVTQHFSGRAAAVINSGHGPIAVMPDDRALQAFGCSPGAKGSYGNGGAEAWPCRPDTGLTKADKDQSDGSAVFPRKLTGP